MGFLSREHMPIEHSKNRKNINRGHILLGPSEVHFIAL
jgi:hypothetical protein